MPFEHKPDSGSVFENDRKERDTQPDFRGDGLIGGREYYISLWINEPIKPGARRRFSLRFNAKDEARQQQQEPRAAAPAKPPAAVNASSKGLPTASTAGDMFWPPDDDIPF